MLVVSNQGERLMLDAATGKTPATPWTVRLFTNNHVPSKDDTEDAYVEANGGGYIALPLDAADWTTVPGSPSASVQPAQLFAFTGALTGSPTIYGYYVTDGADRQVYAERLSAEFTPANNGDFVRVTPRLTLGSVSGD
jgi:hypothetical protein